MLNFFQFYIIQVKQQKRKGEKSKTTSEASVSEENRSREKDVQVGKFLIFNCKFFINNC